MKKLAVWARLMRRHWFLVVCAFFAVYMCVGSDHSLYQIHKLTAQEDALRREIQVYEDSIASFERRINQVDVDVEQLERHARERLHMHRENEDLYLFDD